jgi:hypothetical protein
MATIQSLSGDSAGVAKNSVPGNNALCMTSGTITQAPSLSAVTAVSNGATVDLGAAQRSITFSIVTSAGVSAGAVTLQVSVDGVNWGTPPTGSLVILSAGTLANPLTVASASTTWIVTVPAATCRFARATVSTTITGGTVSVSIVGS